MDWTIFELTVGEIILAVGAILGVIGAVRGPMKWIRRISISLENLMQDWNGTQARPGVDPKPGVMERLASMESTFDQMHEDLGSLIPGTQIADLFSKIDTEITAIRSHVERHDGELRDGSAEHKNINEHLAKIDGIIATIHQIIGPRVPVE